jgi:hypothetical protein
MTLVELGDDVLGAKPSRIIFGVNPKMLQKFIKGLVPKIGDRRRPEAALFQNLVRIHLEMDIVNNAEVLELLSKEFARAPVHTVPIMPEVGPNLAPIFAAFHKSV